MSVVNIAVPLIAAVVDIFRSKKSEVAAQTGLSPDAIGKVGQAVELYLTKDERAITAMMAEVDKARAHDTAMNSQNNPPLVLLMRGLVRPVITLTAFFWYVYARGMGVQLLPEDYAIVGGILAFWFGFRPFEKRAAS